MNPKLTEGVDYVMDSGNLVFTAKYLLERNRCCGNGCRNCPYLPKHTKGSTDTQIDSFKEGNK